jgi:L-ascorbate metabolism protein UlaG (beta-lactamase superfamily)
MKIQLIRNATMRIRFGSICILTDPLFAEKHALRSYAGKSRNPLVELPISPSEALAGVDMILLSHLHSDHFDPRAQEILPKDIEICCQPQDEARLKKLGFSNVHPVGDEINFQGVRIFRIEAQHGKGAVLDEMGPASGYVFISPQEPTVYWIGDSILHEKVFGTIDRFSPDVIITHSSGAVWGKANELIVMDAEQTLQICSYAAAGRVVAVHLDSLDHGTVSRNDLDLRRKQADVPSDRLIIPNDGEILTFDKK